MCSYSLSNNLDSTMWTDQQCTLNVFMCVYAAKHTPTWTQTRLWPTWLGSIWVIAPQLASASSYTELAEVECNFSWTETHSGPGRGSSPPVCLFNPPHHSRTDSNWMPAHGGGLSRGLTIPLTQRVERRAAPDNGADIDTALSLLIQSRKWSEYLQQCHAGAILTLFFPLVCFFPPSSFFVFFHVMYLYLVPLVFHFAFSIHCPFLSSPFLWCQIMSHKVKIAHRMLFLRWLMMPDLTDFDVAVISLP